MVIGVVYLEISIPDANSLKEKRRILKSLIERARNRFNISVAETGLNDVWKSAEISIVTVGNETKFVNSVCSNVLNMFEMEPFIMIRDCWTRIL
ncbi:MAG: DUF503 domain-containing protein [Verrucomicrobiota bacterium]|jgi:uncharacterized protein YlxP (DUF503 family)|nr:DUF503 domain-containing protein [Verrucomicrobiota bacterium]MDD8051332.1 DUF503 domain-containing protein [Verrucomicrobiota bacterium]MDI9383471.1 DUF503 domain-containing protein [Verrucomicrobiota bacterium]HCF95270.1 DUF503 domain-containing protein [Verrucomicrobiota bacterium]